MFIFTINSHVVTHCVLCAAGATSRTTCCHMCLPSGSSYSTRSTTPSICEPACYLSAPPSRKGSPKRSGVIPLVSQTKLFELPHDGSLTFGLFTAGFTRAPPPHTTHSQHTTHNTQHTKITDVLTTHTRNHGTHTAHHRTHAHTRALHAASAPSDPLLSLQRRGLLLQRRNPRPVLPSGPSGGAAGCHGCGGGGGRRTLQRHDAGQAAGPHHTEDCRHGQSHRNLLAPSLISFLIFESSRNTNHRASNCGRHMTAATYLCGACRWAYEHEHEPPAAAAGLP